MKKTNEDSREFSFEFNGKTIYYQQTIKKTIDSSCIDLNNKQKHFLNYYLGEAEIILEKIFGKDTNLTNVTAGQLDYLISLWITNSHLLEGIEKDTLIYSIGAAFGYSINKLTGTVWTYHSNEYGNDFACRSIKEENNPDKVILTFYPFSSTERAIEDKRTDCLQSIMQIVQHNDKWGKWRKEK